MKARKGDIISFYRFFEIFVKFNKIQLQIRPFHKTVCDALQAAALGLSPYLYIVVNICPRIGKTKLMEALCCWQMAYFPDSHIIYTSYAATLAEASTRYILFTIKSEWYIKLFGDIAGGIQRASDFNTKHGGVLKGDGTGGSLTGFGAGLKRRAAGFIVVDDPAKPNEALSKTTAEAVTNWFTNTLLSRRNSSDKTPIIICAQRLSTEDLCGYVIENYGDKVLHLKFPAMVDGKSVVEDTVSTESLKKMEEVDAFTYWSQYQQDPIVLGGNLIKTDWFKYYTDDNLQFEYKFFTGDTAQKTKEANDWTVFACWGVIGQKLYLVDLVRGKFEAPMLETVATEFYQKHHPRQFFIEDKSSGTGLIQSMADKGFPIVAIQREKDKYTRLLDILPFLAVGVLHLKKDAEYIPIFLSECAGFRADMKHKFDDIVDNLIDSVTQVFRGEHSILDSL